MFYAARRIANHYIVSIASTPNAPRIPTYLNNAAAAYGGSASDYEFLILDEPTYNTLLAGLARQPIYLDGAITYAGIETGELSKVQLGNFRRGYVVRKSFTTILDRQIKPVWAGV